MFLEYMRSNEKHPHAIIASSRLVPDNDPTTLFTGSGMQPMLSYLLGQKHPLGTRIADSQKCFRSQDIEEVGDNRHTTFFEMLGNWSLGDYFKEQQIRWMWHFLINELKLDPNNFYVTCFKGNQELNLPRDTYSAELWEKLFKQVNIDANINQDPEKGISDGDKIFYYGDKKNWWSRVGAPANMPIGEPGGPDTEMFYDFDPKEKNKVHQKSIYRDDKCHVNCDCGRFMEIGNNVFMQYKKSEKGFDELLQMNVDHGSGLERIVAAVNNDGDIFNVDVFDNAKSTLQDISGQKYISDLSVTFTDTTHQTFAYRVILDHLRAATFLIGDGVFPGNKDQMYFVRRLIRRAVRYARNLGIHDNFTSKVADTFIDYYRDDYTNLTEKREIIKSELEKEESKFRKTLESGLKEFEKITKDRSEITGEQAFNLLQSYGFPIELTCEIAKEKNYSIDVQGFKNLKEAHSESSRTASVGKFKGGMGGDGEMEIKYHTATHLLHQALREVLGGHVFQKGSNITSERLRFDFSHDSKMTEDQKLKVEEMVNGTINKNLPVIRQEVTYQKAKEMGAIGVFDDKYTDMVSIYHIGQDGDRFSLEFCGGPHVSNTGDMGIFKILKEEAVSQGVRRIKAILE